MLSALILAGVFYWQAKQGKTPGSPKSSNETSTLPQTSENEIATSSPPFVVKGEISGGNPAKKQIIFTFDGGASNVSVQKILETAKKHSVKLTFFVTAKFVEQNPEPIKKIAQEGHEIFNHTYSHPHLTQLTDGQIREELKKCDDVVYNLTGKNTKPYFRPPYGDRDQRVLKIAQEEGYQSVYWSTDALDWMAGRTAEQVKERIYSNLKPGAIILMHVGDDITGNVLDEVFTYIENQGYKIVSLTEGLK